MDYPKRTQTQLNACKPALTLAAWPILVFEFNRMLCIWYKPLRMHCLLYAPNNPPVHGLFHARPFKENGSQTNIERTTHGCWTDRIVHGPFRVTYVHTIYTCYKLRNNGANNTHTHAHAHTHTHTHTHTRTHTHTHTHTPRRPSLDMFQQEEEGTRRRTGLCVWWCGVQ